MDPLEIAELDRLESSHWWYEARRNELLKWASGVKSGSSILDLGSASGGNTLFLASRGFSMTSLEYSDLGVELQRKKCLDVIQADARAAPLQDESFDAVICLDVIEHIEEDALVVKEIFRLLRPNGAFLISVPEDPSMWSSHDVAVSHVRRYDKTSLLQLFADMPVSSLDAKSSNILIKPLVRLVRKFQAGSSLGEVNRFLNRILLAISQFEARVVDVEEKSGMTLWVSGFKANKI